MYLYTYICTELYVVEIYVYIYSVRQAALYYYIIVLYVRKETKKGHRGDVTIDFSSQFNSRDGKNFNEIILIRTDRGRRT